jgi:hypothetical protein
MRGPFQPEPNIDSFIAALGARISRSRMLGLHRPSVSEIEAGNRRVSADELAKLTAQRGKADRTEDVLERAVLASRNGGTPGSQMSTGWRSLGDGNLRR